SMQARPDAPEAAVWEDSLRWDYPLSPEARTLPKPRPRSETAATPMPQVVPRPELPPMTVPPPPAASPAKGRFMLQLGAFAQRENAERLRAELTAKKIDARIAPLASGGKTLFRVLA